MRKELAIDPDKYLNNRLALIQLAKKGIKANKISILNSLYNFNKDFVAEMLNLSTKSVARYINENRKLNASDSELIIKLLILHEKGVEIFGDSQEFTLWLNKPAYALDNVLPIDIISTSDGIDLILEEISRIEFGDLS